MIFCIYLHIPTCIGVIHACCGSKLSLLCFSFSIKYSMSYNGASRISSVFLEWQVKTQPAKSIEFIAKTRSNLVFYTKNWNNPKTFRLSLWAYVTHDWLLGLKHEWLVEGKKKLSEGIYLFVLKQRKIEGIKMEKSCFYLARKWEEDEQEITFCLTMKLVEAPPRA